MIYRKKRQKIHVIKGKQYQSYLCLYKIMLFVVQLNYSQISVYVKYVSKLKTITYNMYLNIGDM